MTTPPDPAPRRWLLLTLTRLAGVAGAVFGLVLVGRATEWAPKLIGIGIVLSALLMMATVPRSLARRWRTPPVPGETP